MKLPVRRVFLYYLPLVINLALVTYLVWQLWQVTSFERDSRVFMFAVLYGLGGLVVAVSGVTSFLHATGQIGGHGIFYALALFNMIVPTASLLTLLYMT
jgi:hypothetical protein